MSAAAAAPPALLRIGEVAERAGTTARTVRYYEEIGLLPGSQKRVHGKHRLYSDADVERLTEIMRLRDLLGLSLENLKQLVEAEEARAALRAEWAEAKEQGADPETRRRILSELLGHVERQLELVRARMLELGGLEADLAGKQARLHELLGELG